MWKTRVGLKDGFIFDYSKMLGERRLTMKDLETFASGLMPAAAKVRKIYFLGTSDGTSVQGRHAGTCLFYAPGLSGPEKSQHGGICAGAGNVRRQD
jgi:hypothetical protein